VLNYNPAFDGIRAFSVLGVMLFHSRVEAVSGGFLGVDIFFVISGFLITGVVVDKVMAGRFSYLSFYTNRALRLLPPLFFVSIAVVGMCLFLGIKVEDSRVIPAVFLYSNIDAVVDPGGAIFNHAWSLSFEEQFYIFWPLLLVIGLRGVKSPALFLVVFYIISTLWRCFVLFDGGGWNEVYLRPDTRISGFILGALLSCLKGRVVIPELAAWLAFLLLGVALGVAGWGQDWVLYWGISAVELLAAIVILSAANRASAFYRFLSFGLFRRVGIISYSLYLVHYPFAWVIRNDVSPMLTFFLVFFISYVLSEFIRFFIEMPMRRFRLEDVKAV